MKQRLFVCLFFCCCIAKSFAQQNDSAAAALKSTFQLLPDEQLYDLGNGRMYAYPKPKKFSFITRLPKDAAGMARSAFTKKSVKPWLLVAGSTALLMWADQAIIDGMQDFSNSVGYQTDESYKSLINVKLGKLNVSLYRAPRNFNTAIYQLGQGFPSLIIGAGLYIHGKRKNDFRALSTASQLAESFLLMGVGTQLIKRITGRESPSDATAPGGKWRFFPSTSSYMNQTSRYDAFPSGHLATLMNSVTILAENYPEKKWIRPVGYSVTALVGLSMINNKVHWASDYPLALALGYLSAKQVVKNSRRELNPKQQAHISPLLRGKMSYALNYVNGRLQPGVLYVF